MEYILTPDGELYHYGVRGMKWGVRRASKKLANASSKEERDAAVATLKKTQQKGSAAMKKLQNKTAKLEARAEKTRVKYESKAPGMRQAAAYKRAKSYGLLNTGTTRYFRRRRAAKLDAKAASLEASAMRAKVRLEKNERMIAAFKTEIKNIDKAIADKGRRYING